MEPKPKLFTRNEMLFWISYFIFGAIIAFFLKLIFGIAFSHTFRGYYGFVYMFFIPGFLFLRALKPYKKYEELAYIGFPFGITFALVMVIIWVFVVLRQPITLFKVFSILTLFSILSLVIFFIKIRHR